MNKNLLSEDERAQIREALSSIPFYQEMDKHLVESGYYDQKLSYKHPGLEQIWWECKKYHDEEVRICALAHQLSPNGVLSTFQ